MPESRTKSRSREPQRQAQSEEPRGLITAEAQKEAARELSALLDARRSQIASFLASDPKMVDRFLTVAMDAITRDRNLLMADPFSLVASVRHAAIMGLEPTSVMGEGAIVVYRDNDQGGKKIAQFQPMVRGLRKLAMNSGDIAALGVDVVRERDHFVFRSGSEPVIEHEPHIPGFGNDDKDSGSVVGAYAYARLKTGELVPLFMSSAEISKRRNIAKTKNVWDSWPEEMAKKTVLRRLMMEKLPLSFRAQNALALSDAIESQGGEVEKVESAVASRTATRLLADVEDGAGADETAGTADDTAEQENAAPEPSEAGPGDADEGEAAEVCGKPGLAEGVFCTSAPGHPGPHAAKGAGEWL